MRKESMIRSACCALALLATLAFVAPFAMAQRMEPDTQSALDAALAGAHRAERNRARDAYRHPKETLAFFGLRRDMTVVEIWPGGGWYTEILAPVLREKGKLYVAQYGSTPAFDYQRSEMAALAEKAKRYPEVFDRMVGSALWAPGELAVAPAGTADLVVTFRNVHNWLDPNYRQDPVTLFRAIFTALKPGGVLGVVDHRWPDPATEDPRASNGYVSEDRIADLAKQAGFVLEARSDVNRNPRDSHDHPRGVWTLPPDLQVEAADRAKYLAIGESDRLTLRFRKPVR